MQYERRRLGTILSGSLSEGFYARLDGVVPLERVRAGHFVSIVGANATFFSLVTDVRIEITDPAISLNPPRDDEPFLREVLRGNSLVASAALRPMLMLADGQRMPVKTVPAHFAPVFEATNAEIEAIFGREGDARRAYFTLGTPLDMNTPVCIDLDRLVERSSGVFGKTGTGKTFLTRLLLAGLIAHKKAGVVIFDMHSEYGLQARTEGAEGTFVKGLKTLFSDRVAIFSLDPASTRRRGGSPDAILQFSYESVSVQDIVSLQHELKLHPTACESAYLIASKYKQRWLAELLARGDQLKELAVEVGANPESIAALYRKVRQIERLPFFHTQGDGSRLSVIDEMVAYIDRGMSIVIEFGNFTSTFCYLLVANIITRRIHQLYMTKTEEFLGGRALEPQKLLIVVEEAHKFLNPQAAEQTIFGVIAREMRKYYVSLLVVDQRPSGIDEEILSQIGTKVLAQLHDEKDISAVLGGVSNAQQLRVILSSLDTKKQTLVLGHAIAMPMVLETRSYDERFYQVIAPQTIANLPPEKVREMLF